MSRVLALVEGQTEQTFIEQVLAPELGTKGVYLSARLIGKPGHKGGARPYPSARKEILMLLREDPGRACTTMFDYYGLPTDWPGRDSSKSHPVPKRAEVIEAGIHADICAEMGSSFNERMFLPYIQLHEFEALLFVSPDHIAKVTGHPSAANRLAEIANEFGDPETIDDNPNSSPSKRLESCIPGFQKVVHGPLAIGQIGLGLITERCAHFGRWIEQLQSLATTRNPSDAE